MYKLFHGNSTADVGQESPEPVTVTTAEQATSPVQTEATGPLPTGASTAKSAPKSREEEEEKSGEAVKGPPRVEIGSSKGKSPSGNLILLENPSGRREIIPVTPR